MASPNSGKWKIYTDGPILYGPSGVGQNLNDDLEQAIGNEQDVVLREATGPGVVSGFVVSAGTGLSVNIALGIAYVDGQRVANSGAAAVSSLTPNATLKIYVQASTPFSNALSAWPPTFGFTAGALVASQLLLATVTTGASSVTNVTDERTLIETKLATYGTVSDATTPAAVATTLNQRLGMFAARIKDIIGGADWLAAVPSSLTAIVATIAARFHATTGHTHAGTTDNGPKLTQANSHQSPDTDTGPTSLHHTIGAGANQAAAGNHAHAASAVTNTPAGGIAATTVQGAINELDTEKAALAHTHAASAVTTGQFALARLATGAADATKFIRSDQTVQLPPGQRDVQTFSAAGGATWTKPSWATASSEVTVILYGGGRGGSSGGSGGDPLVGIGGAGGRGGNYEIGTMLAGDLGATEAVTVGAGGAGGVPDGGATVLGAVGGNSSFKNFVALGGGQAEHVSPLWPGGLGGAGATALNMPSAAGKKAYRGGGGGGGGGGTASGDVNPGAAGGASGQFVDGTGGGGTAPGGAGSVGSTHRGGDGGGGGSNLNRQGGAGGLPGGGGGGGGSNGNTAGVQGTGGAGANGKVWVITKQ